MLLNFKVCFLVILFLCLGISNEVIAQFGDPFGPSSREIKRSPVRKVLNMFSVTATSGYGLTLYSHEISGFSILRKSEGPTYIIHDFNPSLPNAGYTDWIKNPVAENDIRFENEDFAVNSDTAKLGYRGVGSSIPLNIIVHFNIQRFRIGGGFSAEFHTLSKFNPKSFEHELSPFEPQSKRALFTRYFGVLGYKVHDYQDYSFVPEVQFGKLNLGGSYNNGLIQKGMYANIGVSIEKNFSEYLRAIVRPSVEFKNYTLTLPEMSSIVHRQPAFFVTAGISINYPEIPRCKMNACSIQLKHVHGGKEFRGQPLWKKQNPKYGENHRDLIKYKGRNKRIMSPF